MSFERPLITDLLQRIQGDIESRLPGTTARLPTNLLGILARMEAGAAHELYGALDWLARNLLPDTHDEAMLARWASIYGIPRLPASVAKGQVTFTGHNQAIVPAGTRLKADNDVQYSLTADVTLVGGNGTGEVVATQPGASGNLVENSTMTLVSPVAGVQATVTVAGGGVAGGADQESVEDWRERLLSRIQQPPMGGSKSDYERWALEASPAVTDAWVTAHEGGNLGVVTVRIATYGDPLGDLPDQNSPLLDTVYDYIDERRPVAGELHVFAPIPQSVNMTLAIKPETVAVKTAAESALAELFQREAQPGQIIPGQGPLLGTIPVSHVHEAISLSKDEYDHQIHQIGALTPASEGHMLVLGHITWTGWQS